MATRTKDHREFEEGFAGVSRSEPVGRAQRDIGGADLDGPALPGLPGGGCVERPELSDELIDALLGADTSAQAIAGPDGLLPQLTRRLLERALQAEITEHLGYQAGRAPLGGAGNSRNGQPPKTVLTDQGPLRIRSPRDRNGTFEPQIVGKRQTRWVGFDDRVISLYARGLTVREIQGHLMEIYGTEVSPDLISRITDAVIEDAKLWQTRPLDSVYAIVYLDALIVKVRDGHTVRNHACYLAIGVNLEGTREVLGMWFQKTEGAKFWLHVLSELKQRGVQDVLVCCVDGLTGFPEAIEAVFPQAIVQTCLVHLVRQSMRFVPYKDRRQVAADLKLIYTAQDQDAAGDELTRFSEKWDHRFPSISRSWLDRWEYVIPFLAFPADVRRAIYTTNTIEALNRQIRKIIKTRGHFPTEDAARKLLYLAITQAEGKWRQAYNWNACLAAFKIHFDERVPTHAI
ncbi:MAG: IS256 family transposase [Solirubrobacteraceae bacterium]